VIYHIPKDVTGLNKRRKEKRLKRKGKHFFPTASFI
jgi:hypothetical protein